jgi:hypothetical protein
MNLPIFLSDIHICSRNEIIAALPDGSHNSVVQAISERLATVLGGLKADPNEAAFDLRQTRDEIAIAGAVMGADAFLDERAWRVHPEVRRARRLVWTVVWTRSQCRPNLLIYNSVLAETEGFEPSIELYNPITV